MSLWNLIKCYKQPLLSAPIQFFFIIRWGLNIFPLLFLLKFIISNKYSVNVDLPLLCKPHNGVEKQSKLNECLEFFWLRALKWKDKICSTVMNDIAFPLKLETLLRRRLAWGVLQCHNQIKEAIPTKVKVQVSFRK